MLMCRYSVPGACEIAPLSLISGLTLMSIGTPLMTARSDSDGGLQEPFGRIGRLRIEPPSLRRRRRNAIKKRRPAILLRRVVKRLTGNVLVHRGEREIIARN